MNKIILDRILKKLSKKQTKMLIFSLSYYAVLSLFPTILLLYNLLDSISLNSRLYFFDNYQYLLSKNFINITVFCIIIFMISRMFFLLLHERFSLKKSLVFSLIFAISFILFLCSFFLSFLLENIFFSICVKFLLIFVFILSLLVVISEANLKYSLWFSFGFSIISLFYIYFFSLISNYFLDYENIYGILAPFFIVILELHLYIYLIFLSYIGAEEFTKISRIKFIKS